MNIIGQYNSTEITFQADLSDSWCNVKQKLIEKLKLNAEYIDIEFINQKPIREFGKQALLLGKLERIYDDYKLSDFFANASRELKFKIHIVDPTTDKLLDMNNKKKKYYTFNDEEFPSLSTQAKPLTKVMWGKK